MKIKFNLVDELEMITIEVLTVAIVIRAVFHENNKVFLDECLYKL